MKSLGDSIPIAHNGDMNHYYRFLIGSRWAVFLVVMLCGVGSLPAYSTSYYFRGIGGPPVIHDDRIYFTQADDTLTVLDLATGQVIRRFHEARGVYRIQATDSGLFVHGWQTQLLDWSTLKPKWTINGAYDYAFVDSDVLVFNDYWSGQYNRLFAVDITTGNELWSLRWEASSTPMITVGDRAMVITDGSMDDPDVLLLIDVIKGEVLRRVELPKLLNTNRQFAFDGVQMFVIEQPNDPDNEPPLAFTIGNSGELEPAGVFAPEMGRDQPMQIGTQRFDRIGKPIHAAAVDAPPWPKTHRGVDVRGFEVAGSRLTVESQTDISGELTRLKFVSGSTSWQIVAPHLSYRFDVLSMALTDELVLITTSRGNVECLDRMTGQSQWMYVSPYAIGLLSYSGDSRGSFVSSMLGAFDRDQSAVDRRMASRVLPDHVDWSKKTNAQHMLSLASPSKAAVIEDPEPFDPFLIYRDLVFAIRIAPVVIVGMAVLIVWRALRQKSRRLTSIAIGSAGLFLLPVPVLFIYSGMSYFGTQAMKVEMVILGSTVLILGGFSIKQRQRYVVTAITVLTVIVGTCWGWPIFR